MRITLKRWRDETTKGKLKILLFSLLPLVVIGGTLEIFAAMSIHREFEVAKNPLTGVLRYIFRIGRAPWGYQSVTPLNALGFPDDEFVNIRPKGSCLHVVFAGDSLVFGDGVDRDKSFFHLVKHSSAVNNRDVCLRFFNIAQRMTTIEQQAARIRETLPLLNPDIVIVGQYQNDLTDLTRPGFVAHRPQDREPGKRRWTDVRERIRVFNSSLVRYLTYHMFAFMITHNIRYDVLSKWSILEDPVDQATAEHLKAVYEKLYAALLTELRARNIRFGVLTIPSKFDLLAGRSPEERFFVALAEKYHAPYLRLAPVLDSHRARYPFLMYDGHLNEYGNYVVATAVFQWLFETTPPPFPTLRRHIASTDGSA